MASIATDLRAGDLLLGYRVERVLGRGGMGVVYLAQQLVLDRLVALKLLAPELAEDAEFRERFLRESRLAASLDHPNIVPVFDAGEVEGRLYIAMRYVEGRDLGQVLAEEGPLEPARAIALLAPIADALDAAHAKGLVHRDVKPSNILLDQDERPYLADFGLSKTVSERGLVEQSHFGASLGYVAPEQIEGRPVDGRADQYALACVLFESLSGSPPFADGSAMAALWGHLNNPPPRASERNVKLPEAVDPVLQRALAKDSDDRYGTCAELVGTARDALGFAEPTRSRWLRAPLLVGVAGLAVLAASLAAYFALQGGGEAPGPRDTLVQVDPTTNDVVDSIPVGPRASSVTFGDGYVWGTSYEDRTLWRIDPATGKARVTRLAGGTPMDVAVRDGLAVVTYGPFAVGYELVDPSSGVSAGSFRLPGADGAQSPIAAGSAGIWLAASGFEGENVGLLARSPTASGPPATFQRVPIPVDPDYVFFYTPDSGSYNDVAVAEDAVWLVRDNGPILKRIDPVTRRVVRTIELPFRPKSVAVGAGAVWVTALYDDVLARVDPATNKVTLTVPLPAGTDGVAVADGSVWVASTLAGTVTRVDPETGEILATIDVGTRPEDVAAGAGSIWVTTHTT
jgi:streptogramin lyase/predicted Ser/Thr protein kinase